MNKRGQFFLIAALVIISIILSLSIVYNRANAQEEDTQVYDLSNEATFETAQVIDNGVYSENIGIKDRVKSLTEYYSKVNPESDIYFIYGDLSGIKYSCVSTGSTDLSAGGAVINLDICQTDSADFTPHFNEQDGNIRVDLNDGISEEFRIKQGQYFYIIVKKDTIGGDTVVTKNE